MYEKPKPQKPMTRHQKERAKRNDNPIPYKESTACKTLDQFQEEEEECQENQS
jgi:hypothetical protein